MLLALLLSQPSKPTAGAENTLESCCWLSSNSCCCFSKLSVSIIAQVSAQGKFCCISRCLKHPLCLGLPTLLGQSKLHPRLEMLSDSVHFVSILVLEPLVPWTVVTCSVWHQHSQVSFIVKNAEKAQFIGRIFYICDHASSLLPSCLSSKWTKNRHGIVIVQWLRSSGNTASSTIKNIDFNLHILQNVFL